MRQYGENPGRPHEPGDHSPYIQAVYAAVAHRRLQPASPTFGWDTYRHAEISFRSPTGGDAQQSPRPRLLWDETQGWRFLVTNELGQELVLRRFPGVVPEPFMVAEWAKARHKEFRSTTASAPPPPTFDDLFWGAGEEPTPRAGVDALLAAYHARGLDPDRISATVWSPIPKKEQPSQQVRVAVTNLTEIMLDHLMGSRSDYTGGEFSIRRGDWRRGRHLCVFLAADSSSPHSTVGGLGIADTSGRAGDFEKRLAVSEFRTAEVRISVAELKEMLGQFRDGLDRNGTLPPARGRELLDALRKRSPGFAEQIDRLTRLLNVEPPTSTDRPVRPFERDAVGVLFEAFDIDREILKDWRPSTTGANFVHGLTGRDLAPHESWHISHDQSTFLGWFREHTESLSWGLFRNRYKTRTLLVANVDRTGVEAETGVDLVYYNPHHGSFVLIQYKKMEEVAGGDLVSRVDDHFLKQLQRMREVDEKHRDNVSNHPDLRLVETPCFVKLCRPETRIPNSSELVPGMYLTREHFETVHTSPAARGPHDGIRVGEATAQRYLTNTEFASLLSNVTPSSIARKSPLWRRKLAETSQ